MNSKIMQRNLEPENWARLGWREREATLNFRRTMIRAPKIENRKLTGAIVTYSDGTRHQTQPDGSVRKLP